LIIIGFEANAPKLDAKSTKLGPGKENPRCDLTLISADHRYTLELMASGDKLTDFGSNSSSIFPDVLDNEGYSSLELPR
jgi:hypothetical protein